MRYSYGGSIADWTFRTVATSEVGDLAQVLGGVEVTFWSARDGGLQYTDLLSVESMPVSSVFTESAGDVGATGQIPPFFGPDGVSVMWASADGGPRALIRTNDLPAHVHDAADIVTGVIDPDRLPAGVGGIGDPGTLWVAAADAPGEFGAAQYVCDGVDDQVQIQAALDAAGGKQIVRLSPGIFQLSAPIRLTGTEDAGYWTERTLIGYGPTVTTLDATSGISSAIEMYWRVSPHVADLLITIDGATHGIASVEKDFVVPNVSGGTFNNIKIEGTWTSLQSGWGLHLDSVKRSEFERIHIEGAANGIRVFNSDEAGSLSLNQIYIDIYGLNRRGFSVEAMNGTDIADINVTMMEIVGDGSGTKGVVLEGVGSATVSRCTFRGMSVSWVDRLFDVYRGRDNVFESIYADLDFSDGLTAVAFDANSWNNAVILNSFYVGMTSTLVNDANTAFPGLPNRIQKASLETESGVVVTQSPNPARTTLLADVTDRGIGDISSVSRSPLARGPHAVISLGSSGTTGWVLDGRRGSHWRIQATGNFTLSNPSNLVDGQMIYLDVTQDATGARTMTVGSKFRFSATFPNATLSTAAGKKDKLAFQYNAVDDKLDIIYFIKGI